MNEIVISSDVEVIEDVESGLAQLTQIETEISSHLRMGMQHLRAVYVLLALIRQYELYKFAVDSDGEQIVNWDVYVREAASRFSLSRSWIYNRVRLYRLGISAGITEEELLDVDTLSLGLASNIASTNRSGELVVHNPEALGIAEEEELNTEQIAERVATFIREIDALPPDERVTYVRGDLLNEIEYYFMLNDDFSISYWSTEEQEVRPLSEANEEVIRKFKKMIKDEDDE